jgi:heat shock protein HslJ
LGDVGCIARSYVVFRRRRCEPAVMGTEASYLRALRDVDRVGRSADQLILTGPAVKLTFAALPPVPTEELVDTTWELETVIVDEIATTADDAASLRLGSDGVIEGSTACRGFTGLYVIRGDEIVVTELRMQDEPITETCPNETRDQDEILVSVIGDRFQAKVDDDRLTLTSGCQDLI